MSIVLLSDSNDEMTSFDEELTSSNEPTTTDNKTNLLQLFYSFLGEDSSPANVSVKYVYIVDHFDINHFIDQ